MALLDDILNKNKKSSVYPTRDRDLEEQAVSVPEIPVVKASDGDDKQPGEIVQSQQGTAAAPADNKWGYSQSEMETLVKAGYTPDRLEYLNSGFDPSKGENFLQHIYQRQMPTPQGPDEKQLKRARLIGSIADSLGLLSQMWSAGKGAHVKEMNYKQSASAQVADNEKNLRNVYLQQQNKYNEGLYNARLKDLSMALDDYNTGRKGIGDVLAAKRKADQSEAQFQDRQRFAYDKLAQDKTNKEADRKIKEDNLKSLDRYRKSMEAQGWSRVADSRNRTAAYVKKISSGGSNNAGYQMIFGANPDDTDTQTDNFGNKVKVFEMNKGQLDRYAREALSDHAFLQKHPQFDRKPGLLGEAPKSFTEKERVDIAAAYMQEMYESSFEQTAATHATETIPMPNWGETNGFRVPGWDKMPGNADVQTEEEDTEDWNWID